MQVEHTQHDSEDVARQDNLGALHWEAYIEVQHSSAVPAQQARTAGISSEAAGGLGQGPSISGAPADGAETPEEGPTAGAAPSIGNRAAAGPIKLPSSSVAAGDGAQTPDQGPSEAPVPSTGTQSSPAATGYAAKVAAPQSSQQPSVAEATLHEASAQPADAAAVGLGPAPWSDADGRLNKPYWRSLTQRAMSAVLRSPGASTQHHCAPLRETSGLCIVIGNTRNILCMALLKISTCQISCTMRHEACKNDSCIRSCVRLAGIPEEALLDELEALLPQSAKQLLGVLEKQGLLSVRSMALPAPQIPAIVRRPGQTAAPAGKVSILAAVGHSTI